MKSSLNTATVANGRKPSLRGTDADTGRAFWGTKPSELASYVIGYFGVYGSMSRGQAVQVVAECCGDRFKVVPVTNRKRICGGVRVVKRKNLSLVQRDLFLTA